MICINWEIVWSMNQRRIECINKCGNEWRHLGSLLQIWIDKNIPDLRNLLAFKVTKFLISWMYSVHCTQIISFIYSFHFTVMVLFILFYYVYFSNQCMNLYNSYWNLECIWFSKESLCYQIIQNYSNSSWKSYIFGFFFSLFEIWNLFKKFKNPCTHCINAITKKILQTYLSL